VPEISRHNENNFPAPRPIVSPILRAHPALPGVWCREEEAAAYLAFDSAMPVAMQAVSAPTPAPPLQDDGTVTLDAAALFRLAERAEAADDLAGAETAYRALAEDPDPELHTEARFRLALILADRRGQPAAAAALLDRILAEKPGAARARLELARIEAQMGHRSAAARALGAVRAAPLPAEVERMVRFFANRLAEARPLAGDLQISALADSNVNRATRSDTLGTIIGDFQLDRDARARPALGLGIQAQGLARIRLARRQTGSALAAAELPSNLQVRLVTNAELYRASRFSSVGVSLLAGPDLASGKDRLRLAAGPSWRWYGGRPFSVGWGGTAEWVHPIGQRARLRMETAVTSSTNRRNALQDGMIYTASLSLDRVLSQRSGGGLQVQASRTTAADPGYADVSAGATAYFYRTAGAATFLLSGSYQRLEADARVFLYPRRRQDDRWSALASASLDKSLAAGFAPFLRLRAERNRSTLTLYAYTRFAAEAGLSRSF